MKKRKINTRVVVQHTIPILQIPVMQSGIVSLAQAKDWGIRMGYAVVYYLPSRSRVYAERTSLRVNDTAKDIQKKSARLVEEANEAL